MSQIATIEERSYHILNELFGPAKAGAVLARARKLSPAYRDQVLSNFLDDLQDVEPEAGKVVFEASREFAGRLIKPVGVEEFLIGKRYLATNQDTVFPVVLSALIEMNNGYYNEAVLTGGIGTAKTTLALWTTAYQLYLLSLYLQPQRELGQDRTSEIIFVFQSITATLAKTVDFERFREMMELSPYFRHVFPFDHDLKSQLLFPRRIIVKPVSGQETATIGQNVFGGVMDEVNYMAKVEKSKQTVDGGDFDQAVRLYNSISRRRESRFRKLGKPIPGMLCLVSSTRYPGEFTDQKIAEAKKNKRIYLYHKTIWEVKPKEYGKKRFVVFIGDDSRNPRILSPTEKVHPKDRELVRLIPEEIRPDFERDIINALREVAGVATLSRFPFFMNRKLLAAAFGKTPSIMDKTTVDFDRETVKYFVKRFQNPFAKRCVHVDLALTGDAAGIACGYVENFTSIQRGGGVIEVLPNMIMDFTLRVTPPHNDEIKFDKIRSLLYMLREAGLNIQWVSFDSYQSRYLMQLLRQQGFTVALVSCDEVPCVPYDFLKGAIYDGRMSIPKDDFAKKEMSQLEKGQEKGKVDHPPNGSKDVADALAGVAYGLTMKRVIWSDHDVSPVQIPQYITEMAHRKGAMNDQPLKKQRVVQM